MKDGSVSEKETIRFLSTSINEFYLTLKRLQEERVAVLMASDLLAEVESRLRAAEIIGWRCQKMAASNILALLIAFNNDPAGSARS